MIYLESLWPALLLFAWFILPFFVTYHICKGRNRSVGKGLFVTFFTGWLGAVLLWLGLKRRNPDTQMLY